MARVYLENDGASCELGCTEPNKVLLFFVVFGFGSVWCIKRKTASGSESSLFGLLFPTYTQGLQGIGRGKLTQRDETTRREPGPRFDAPSRSFQFNGEPQRITHLCPTHPGSLFSALLFFRRCQVLEVCHILAVAPDHLLYSCHTMFVLSYDNHANRSSCPVFS